MSLAQTSSQIPYISSGTFSLSLMAKLHLKSWQIKVPSSAILICLYSHNCSHYTYAFSLFQIQTQVHNSANIQADATVLLKILTHTQEVHFLPLQKEMLTESILFKIHSIYTSTTCRYFTWKKWWMTWIFSAQWGSICLFFSVSFYLLWWMDHK